MRKVSEWIGKTDDSAIPDRVKARIIERQGNRCAVTNKPFMPGDVYHYDHVIPLWLGGRHAENNLVAILAGFHTEKTKGEAAVRAKVYRQRNKHLGLREKKPWNKRFKKKLDGSVVER